MEKKKYKFGETKEYKEGDVVVWGGRKPCIGKIVRRNNEDLHMNCWVIDEEHNSLHYSNLRYATHEEIKQLGDRQKLLTTNQK